MATLTLSLAWSKSLLGAVLAAHIVPLTAVLSANTPWWVRVVVLLGVFLSAGMQFARFRKFVGASILLRDNGEAAFVAAGISRAISILDSSVDLGIMVILHWRSLDLPSSGAAVFTRDRLTPYEWRALRTWVRWRINRSSV